MLPDTGDCYYSKWKSAISLVYDKFLPRVRNDFKLAFLKHRNITELF